MAARSRDAIFELVVLKEKFDQDQSRDKTIAQDTHSDHQFKVAEARDGSVADGSTLRSTLKDYSIEEKVDLASREVSGYGGTADSLDSTASSSERKLQHILKFLIFIIVLALVLFLGLIIGLSLASANKSQLTKLEHTTSLDGATYQRAQDDFQAMLSEMREGISSLNHTALDLSQKLEQLNQRLNASSSTLGERINSTRNDLASQSRMLAELASQLNESLGSNTRRLETLEASGMSFNLTLMDLDEAHMNSSRSFSSAIGTLKTRISSPVQVFANCTSENRTNAMSFSAGSVNVSDLLYRVQTDPLPNMEVSN